MRMWETCRELFKTRMQRIKFTVRDGGVHTGHERRRSACSSHGGGRWVIAMSWGASPVRLPVVASVLAVVVMASMILVTERNGAALAVSGMRGQFQLL